MKVKFRTYYLLTRFYKVLQGFNDYTLFGPCNDDALLVDDSHVLDLRSNP